MTELVRTVSGDIAPSALGRVDVHEHLLMRTPALPGETLDDVASATAEASLVRDSGIDALVELTTLGLGRDGLGLRTIAERSGVRIVMATGVQSDVHHPAGDPLHRVSTDELADRLTADIVDGYDGVRAGMLKVGIGYWSISAFERRNLEAAAEAHRRTGVPITCHLELGSAGAEVLELFDRLGVPRDRIVLAHIDRNPDPRLHRELARSGAYLSYDGWARPKYFPDSQLLDCLLAVAADGCAERILLGGDIARRSSLRANGGLPGMDYLGRRVIPRIVDSGGDALAKTILVTNPRRVLTLSISAE